MRDIINKIGTVVKKVVTTLFWIIVKLLCLILILILIPVSDLEKKVKSLIKKNTKLNNENE